MSIRNKIYGVLGLTSLLGTPDVTLANTPIEMPDYCKAGNAIAMQTGVDNNADGLLDAHPTIEHEYDRAGGRFKKAWVLAHEYAFPDVDFKGWKDDPLRRNAVEEFFMVDDKGAMGKVLECTYLRSAEEKGKEWADQYIMNSDTNKYVKADWTDTTTAPTLASGSDGIFLDNTAIVYFPTKELLKDGKKTEKKIVERGPLPVNNERDSEEPAWFPGGFDPSDLSDLRASVGGSISNRSWTSTYLDSEDGTQSLDVDEGIRSLDLAVRVPLVGLVAGEGQVRPFAAYEAEAVTGIGGTVGDGRFDGEANRHVIQGGVEYASEDHAVGGAVGAVLPYRKTTEDVGDVVTHATQHARGIQADLAGRVRVGESDVQIAGNFTHRALPMEVLVDGTITYEAAGEEVVRGFGDRTTGDVSQNVFHAGPVFEVDNIGQGADVQPYAEVALTSVRIAGSEVITEQSNTQSRVDVGANAGVNLGNEGFKLRFEGGFGYTVSEKFNVPEGTRDVQTGHKGVTGSARLVIRR